jgi:hypothetical protein
MGRKARADTGLCVKFMTDEQIKKQFEEIEAIYTDFKNRIAILSRERNKIINDFLKDLENNKLEELRQIIANQ